MHTQLPFTKKLGSPGGPDTATWGERWSATVNVGQFQSGEWASLSLKHQAVSGPGRREEKELRSNPCREENGTPGEMGGDDLGPRSRTEGLLSKYQKV